MSKTIVELEQCDAEVIYSWCEDCNSSCELESEECEECGGVVINDYNNEEDNCISCGHIFGCEEEYYFFDDTSFEAFKHIKSMKMAEPYFCEECASRQNYEFVLEDLVKQKEEEE